jgi:hypothetical protein
VTNFNFQPLYPLGNSLRYPFDRTLGGFQILSGYIVDIPSTVGIRVPAFEPVVSQFTEARYEVFTAMNIQFEVFWVVTTNWAIPTHVTITRLQFSSEGYGLENRSSTKEVLVWQLEV